MKFFTWDLTLKIERTLTHFNNKKQHCSVRGRSPGTGQGFCRAAQPGSWGHPPTWPQHNTTPSKIPGASFLKGASVSPKSRGDFRGKVTCLKQPCSSGQWCSLEIWFLKLLCLWQSSQAWRQKLSQVQECEWRPFISGESYEDQVGTVPVLSLGKDALDKTEGLCSPAWPGHRV